MEVAIDVGGTQTGASNWPVIRFACLAGGVCCVAPEQPFSRHDAANLPVIYRRFLVAAPGTCCDAGRNRGDSSGRAAGVQAVQRTTAINIQGAAGREEHHRENEAIGESRLRPRLLYGTLRATSQWQRPACRHF